MSIPSTPLNHSVHNQLALIPHPPPTDQVQYAPTQLDDFLSRMAINGFSHVGYFHGDIIHGIQYKERRIHHPEHQLQVEEGKVAKWRAWYANQLPHYNGLVQDLERHKQWCRAYKGLLEDERARASELGLDGVELRERYEEMKGIAASAQDEAQQEIGALHESNDQLTKDLDEARNELTAVRGELETARAAVEREIAAREDAKQKREEMGGKLAKALENEAKEAARANKAAVERNELQGKYDRRDEFVISYLQRGIGKRPLTPPDSPSSKKMRRTISEDGMGDVKGEECSCDPSGI